MRFLLDLAWRDLRASGRRLWIFAACLVLGVSLVAAGGGLYGQVSDGLRDDARRLFGGDVAVEARQALPPEALAWMQARATVSHGVELRTMLRTADGRAQLVELQGTDDTYPLYGRVELQPAGPLPDALAWRQGRWGAAIDGALAQRLGLQPGDRVAIGDLELTVRAIVLRQPDRSLRADWGAAPVLVADGALQATGLLQPFSRVEYRYRVRTSDAAPAWRDAFLAAYPALDAEVRSFDERSDRMAEVLGQIGSGLLLVGFSALFIGGWASSTACRPGCRAGSPRWPRCARWACATDAWPPWCCCRC
jgi:putative ABC transport system permease protein